MILRLFPLVLASASLALAQDPLLERMRMIDELRAGAVVRANAGVARPAAANADESAGENAEPSPRLQSLSSLQFDRRPSTILSTWATPPEPEEEPEEETVEETPPDAEPAEPSPAEVEAATRRAALRCDLARGAWSAVATDLAAIGEAAAARRAAEEAEAAKAAAAEEARVVAREMADLQRHVTLGDWAAVGSYLAGLTEDERKAGYNQLLNSLLTPFPPPPGISSQGRQYAEKNSFAPADVLGLAEAASLELTDAHLASLGRILRMALDDGHELQDFLPTVTPRLGDEGFPLDRRKLARLLLGAQEELAMGEFLPTTDEAEAADDREGLNLIARHARARFAKDGTIAWLAECWRATQAVLAVGEVEEKLKTEALARAVDIAPRVEEELGQAWLDESFTARPERGMEILAVIGTGASQGLQSQPGNAAQRKTFLKLQTTAAEALLAAAPERADEWQPQLELLAANWLREAQLTYQLDDSTSLVPRMQRDPFGNYFYTSSRSFRGGMVAPIPSDEIIAMRPGEEWLRRVSDTLQPRLRTVFAQLYLKLAEEDQAFPYIEEVAATHPDQAKELVDEFLRVWSRNHDPNAANRNSNQYAYFYGFEERANAIPLTRSKQERNLQELGEWVARLRELPVELDDRLLATAFTRAHSSAEVYRIETIERIFGSMDALEPGILAELLQTMRTNLASIWRDPALQKDKGTGRRQKDIEAEVLRGYELGRATVDRALEDHGDSWELVLALASFEHDENNYRRELGNDSEFSARREGAFATFRRAAELYAATLADLLQEEESTRVQELWFYAALGACDLGALDSKMVLAADQIPLIRSALTDLPGERAERHVGMFASTLFSRMSGVNPAVKYRYVRTGLEITGEHELVAEARQVFDYYEDLVTEIQLVATIDGSDRVGHGAPFGLRVDLRHTREIERESGGFSKYLQNQNAQAFGFNYGRPTEDYRDKFEETAREALAESFEVVSVTFNAPAAGSVADAEYGWRVTPYAYVLLKPRGPQVDRIPPLRIDLDFLDTTGYVVLPVESPPVPIDARAPVGEERPYHRLALTRNLNERFADEGKLILEVEATANGLVPDVAALVDLESEGFEVAGIEDLGVSVVKFDEEEDGIVSERSATVTLQAVAGLPAPPASFTFGAPRVETVANELYRYVDADLTPAERVVALEQEYGEPGRPWLPWLFGGLVAVLVAVFAARRFARRPKAVAQERFTVPDPMTPFTVLGLLRDIEGQNGLPADGRLQLAAEIESLERHFFGEPAPEPPDLRRIAEGWIGRAT